MGFKAKIHACQLNCKPIALCFDFANLALIMIVYFRGWKKISVNAQMINIFNSVDHTSSVATPQLCHYYTKTATCK